MNRRDFLQFKTQGSSRIAEIDCQRLHVNYVSLQATAAAGRVEHDDFADDEPPPVFTRRTVEQLFNDLAKELQEADAICVLQPRWLVPEGLRAAFDEFIRPFARSGGVIEYTA
jgi:hypothetical protein